MAEVSLRCADNWFQGSVEARMCVGEVYTLFFLCVFYSLIFGVCLEQTSSQVYIFLITKAIHIHENFKQYRKKAKN